MARKNRNRGSITLEAAIMVPMFIIIMLFLNGLFILFMGQQIMSHTLIQTAKSMAYDPYSSQRVTESTDDTLANMFVDIFSFAGGDHISTVKWYGEDQDRLQEIAKKRYIAYLKNSRTDAEELLEGLGIKNGYYGLDFSGSSVENGVLTLSLKYTQKYIFNVSGLTEFERELIVKIKLFEHKA